VSSCYAQLLADAPAPRLLAGARAEIAARNAADDRRIAVLDDDPTGSQSVHGVQIVLAPRETEYRRALERPGSTAFLLTNTRSLAPDDAARLNERAGAALLEIGRDLAAPVTLVSRSDSTLRGHMWVEVAALHRAARTATGRGFDAVLLAPAFLEAGRATIGGVHWARVGGQMVPAAETEFAGDASFGYRSSNLRDWVVERTDGAVRREDVGSLSLEDIRCGGPERVAEVLGAARDGQFIVVDAVEFADLDVVALGVLDAQDRGQRLLHRTGPSMVRSLAGVPDRDRLTHAEIWPSSGAAGPGLVVVGSHVGLTNSQLEVALRRADLRRVELPVAELAGESAEVVRRTAAEVRDGLRHGHVLLQTSREVRTGTDAASSLAIAREVSTALSASVRAVRELPGWVIAKGGITSHDIAVRGLGIRRATVLGQLLDGQVSVFDPTELDPTVPNSNGKAAPYVVFAGNVGDEHTLSKAIDVLSGSTDRMPS
jgi:uncharacterized protein YgbK (DUF1537 family)